MRGACGSVWKKKMEKKNREEKEMGGRPLGSAIREKKI